MKREKGFTLIELLVAATIIIVLSVIGIVSYTNSGKSARDSRRKADLESVRQALVLYRADNGSYVSSGGTITSGNFDTIISGLSPDYISQPTPVDPKNSSPYIYRASSATGSFCLCADMEGGKGNSTARNCSSFSTSGDYYCLQNP